MNKFILIACEESQRVCIEFRKLGFFAFSCDLLDCSGGHPEWHIKGDVLNIIDGNCFFTTCDGSIHHILGSWDCIIAFPPCTYLTNTGNKWFNKDKFPVQAVCRETLRFDAFTFVKYIYDSNCEHIAIENPIGYLNTHLRKPNQIIQPYFFGDTERKSTCLWLKNLPNLVPTDIVEPQLIYYKNGSGVDSKWHFDTINLPPKERSIARSKTFPGIAKAMASQWSKIITQ